MHEPQPEKRGDGKVARAQQSKTTPINILYQPPSEPLNSSITIPPLSPFLLKYIAIRDESILKARGMTHLSQ